MLRAYSWHHRRELLLSLSPEPLLIFHLLLDSQNLSCDPLIDIQLLAILLLGFLQLPLQHTLISSPWLRLQLLELGLKSPVLLLHLVDVDLLGVVRGLSCINLLLGFLES